MSVPVLRIRVITVVALGGIRLARTRLIRCVRVARATGAYRTLRVRWLDAGAFQEERTRLSHVPVLVNCDV